jgi:hypothetical protein
VKLSLETLLRGLVNQGVMAARRSTNSVAASGPTSIRLKPATKAFLDHQAEALGTSVQSLITMILDGVAVATMDDTAGSLRTIRERFFYLFNAHKLDLPAIVSVMKGHGFTLSALDDGSRLLDLLSQEAIRHMASTFFVRAEWVSAASDRITEQDMDVHWYKNVHSAGRQLLDLARQGFRPHVMFLRRKGADFEQAKAHGDGAPGAKAVEEPVGLVVKLHRSTLDGIVFDTYQVWEFERWNYWRCREQLKLLIAFCDEAHSIISYAGYELPREAIDAMVEGHSMPSDLLGKVSHVAWYPDDYASIKHKVTLEIDEWRDVEKKYRDEKYSELIEEYLGG